MTILFFARRFYPLIGGVEKHVLEVGKRLVEKGHRVIVITEYEKNANIKNQQSLSLSATIEGIEICRIDAGKEDKFKKFRVWLKLLKHLRVINSSDVVHCHDIFFWYLPFRFLFPFKKVYTTFHGYEGNKIPNKKAIFMHRLSEKLSLGNICVGDYLKKWYGTKPTLVTYGAVDENQIKHKPINNKQNYFINIVFLGRLEEETGIMEYLKAFKIISKKYPSLRLEVLGDGSLRGEAERYVKENKLNVKFQGFVGNTDKFIERASFVFVSRHLGILESLMSKKYVLAVYNNVIKKDYLQMVPFADFISISANSSELANELDRYILDESLKLVKIEKGFDWVKNQSWEKMVNFYLKLWNIDKSTP